MDSIQKMDSSISSIQKIDTGPETTDTNSESWDERKKEKFHKKHIDLMNQRLRSRQQKTKRLKEITPTEYNETITYNDDVVQHLDKLNDPNTDIKSTVVDLFAEKNGGKRRRKSRRRNRRTKRTRRTRRK